MGMESAYQTQPNGLQNAETLQSVRPFPQHKNPMDFSLCFFFNLLIYFILNQFAQNKMDYQEQQQSIRLFQRLDGNIESGGRKRRFQVSESAGHLKVMLKIPLWQILESFLFGYR